MVRIVLNYITLTGYAVCRWSTGKANLLQGSTGITKRLCGALVTHCQFKQLSVSLQGLVAEIILWTILISQSKLWLWLEDFICSNCPSQRRLSMNVSRLLWTISSAGDSANSLGHPALMLGHSESSTGCLHLLYTIPSDIYIHQ